MVHHLKGSQNVDLAEAFLAAFPLSDDPDNPTVVTLDQFDAWAEGEGIYSLDAERDTINRLRNTLRRKINVSAASPAWTAFAGMNAEGFHIRVLNHGKDYVVEPTTTAFEVKVQKLPSEMQSSCSTKLRTVLALFESIDLEKLPIAGRVSAELISHEMLEFLEDMSTKISRFHNKLELVKAVAERESVLLYGKKAPEISPPREH